MNTKHQKEVLKSIASYNRLSLVEISNDSDEFFEETNIFFTDFELKDYSSLIYNSENLITSILNVFLLEDIAIINQTNYSYNENSHLIKFERKSKEQDVDNFDQKKLLENPDKYLKKQKYLDASTNKGSYVYDDKNSVLSYTSQHSKNGKQHCKISYENTKTTISRFDNNNLTVQYEFQYDDKNNPISEKRFIFIDGKKYLDTETTLKISYYI